MTKMKRWIIEKYIPEWCRQSLLEENLRLRARLERAENKANGLQMYIDGMTDAQRALRRITIQNSVCAEKGDADGSC